MSLSLLFVASSSIIYHIFALFISEMHASLTSYIVQIISDHLFCLDPVTTAVWLVFFDLIILSTLHWAMAYSSSVHNNLDSLWVIFSRIGSQALLMYTSVSSLSFPKLWTYLRFQHHTALYPLSCLISWDWTSSYELCALFVYSLPVSHLTLATSITISCPEWSDINYTWISSPICQNMLIWLYFFPWGDVQVNL
jgi:hypothetical protein